MGIGPLASTERSLMDAGSVFSTGYQSKECTTAGLPTGLNYWRPQSILLWIPGTFKSQGLSLTFQGCFARLCLPIGFMEMSGPWSNVFVSAKNGEEAEQELEEQGNWKKETTEKCSSKAKATRERA